MKRLNFRKISAIASSALMVGMTVGVAAAASYPAPFISGSTADVAVVYGTGSGVSTLDVVQAGNIQSDLSARTGTGSKGGSVTGGDSVLIAKSSNNLNLGDNFTVFTGSIDEDDLGTLLADGTYSADDNDEFDYEQSIDLGASIQLSHFRDSDYEELIGATQRTPAVGFKIASNIKMLAYTLDFTQDAESDIVSGDLDDIEGSDMLLMGKTYYVSDLKNGTNAATLGKLTLLDSATVSSVGEGETVTVSSGGNTYEVGIHYIDNDEVTFTVNGELAPKTGKLQKGESYKISDGSYIGARDISKLEVSGELGSASFSIGTGKLEITSGSDIKLNDDSIQGVKGYVYRGTGTSTTEKIDKIQINWTTDDEAFISPGYDLVMPGFGALKFTMNPLVRPEEEKVTVEPDGDSSIQITVPVRDGDVNFNLLYSNASGSFTGLGKAADDQLATTNESVLRFFEKQNGNNLHSYFVASYNTTQEAESYLLRAKISEDSDNGRNETDIEKKTPDGWEVVCSEKAAGNTCDIGLVSLTISQIEYQAGKNESINVTAGTDVHFNTIYTKGGLRIWLPVNVTNSTAGTTPGRIALLQEAAVNASAGMSADNYWLLFDGEDKDENIAAGTDFNITLDDTSDKLQVSQVSNAGSGGKNGLENEVIGNDVYETYIVDDVAPRILHYTNPDEDYAEIYYPTGDSETYAEVYLAESGAVATAGSSGSSATIGNVLFTDSEQSSWSGSNVIVVGGSCINSAAATALGVSSGTCGAAFTDATGVGSGEFLIESVGGAFTPGKIALVVAGYGRDDTVAATSYLTNVGVDTAAGNKYVGTSATEATLQVMEA